jgi:two-component system, NarL family, sensor kinase
MQKTPNDIIIFFLVTTLLIVIMAGFIITILYFYRRRQIVYHKEIETIKSEFEKTLLKTQLEIQEQTFQNISREIHDHICLNLTLAKLNLVTIDHGNSHQFTDNVNSSIEILGRSIHELSDISHSMNPEIIESNGLIAALELEIAKMRKLNLFQINLNIKGNPVYMDSQKELFIFRIIQEAFNNVLKHAKAKNVQLYLYYDHDSMNTTVQDDGQGFQSTTYHENDFVVHHSGLKNMRKRAQLINGNCDIQSEPGKGTKIKLSVPY